MTLTKETEQHDRTTDVHAGGIPATALLPSFAENGERMARSLAEVAFYFGVSLRTLEKHAAAGKIPRASGGYPLDQIRARRKKAKGVVEVDDDLGDVLAFVPVWLDSLRTGSQAGMWRFIDRVRLERALDYRLAEFDSDAPGGTAARAAEMLGEKADQVIERMGDKALTADAKRSIVANFRLAARLLQGRQGDARRRLTAALQARIMDIFDGVIERDHALDLASKRSAAT